MIKNVINLFNRNIFFIITLALCQMHFQAFGAKYFIPKTTEIVDGDTFCGGSACTSSDTIIINGGTRAGLTFQDFDGKGSYITVKNDPNVRVILDSNLGAGIGVFTITNCRYVNFTMNNNPNQTYGVKVINGPKNLRSGAIKPTSHVITLRLGILK